MQKKRFWSILFVNLVLIFLVLYLLCTKQEPCYRNNIQTPQQASFEEQLIKTRETTISSVVNIIAEEKATYYQESNSGKPLGVSQKKGIVGEGSGIIGSKKGYILTNKHVVENDDLVYQVVSSDGDVFPVKKIWKDAYIDLAVLLIDVKDTQINESKFIHFNDKVSIGQFILAIGNSLSEYTNTTSFGIISGKGRQLSLGTGSSTLYLGLYQTDAALNPGNSGGPLINLSGEVIGMVTAISRGGNNIGFALPLTKEFVDITINSLIKYNQLIRPYLGVSYSDQNSGSVIDIIYSGSPVEGILSAGDRIIAVDHYPVSQTHPLLYYLYIHKPGDTVVLTIERAGQTSQIPIVLGSKSI